MTKDEIVSQLRALDKKIQESVHGDPEDAKLLFVLANEVQALPLAEQDGIVLSFDCYRQLISAEARLKDILENQSRTQGNLEPPVISVEVPIGSRVSLTVQRGSVVVKGIQ